MSALPNMYVYNTLDSSVDSRARERGLESHPLPLAGFA